MKYCPECGCGLVERTIDGAERLACSADSCDYVYWDNPTPVVAAIVEHDGEVILVRSKGWPEAWFGIVAGFLEKRETPEDAVLREIKEELGLDGEIVSFIGYYTFFRKNQLILVFHVKAEGDVILGDELVDYKSIHPDKLRPWRFGTGPAVKDWLVRRKKL